MSRVTDEAEYVALVKELKDGGLAFYPSLEDAQNILAVDGKVQIDGMIWLTMKSYAAGLILETRNYTGVSDSQKAATACEIVARLVAESTKRAKSKVLESDLFL